MLLNHAFIKFLPQISLLRHFKEDEVSLYETSPFSFFAFSRDCGNSIPKVMNRKSFPNILVIGFLLSLAGCATVGPSVIKTYNDISQREQIAVLRAEQKMGLTIIACDGLNVPRSTRYILLKPGRHEIWFSISGQTLLETYNMTNKKYLDAEAGHTYILKSKGGGILFVGDNWFPEVIDVTDNIYLHVQTLPQEIERK